MTRSKDFLQIFIQIFLIPQSSNSFHLSPLYLFGLISSSVYETRCLAIIMGSSIESSDDSFDSSHLLIFRIPSRMKKASRLNGTLEKLLMAWFLMKSVSSPWLKRGISNAKTHTSARRNAKGSRIERWIKAKRCLVNKVYSGF